MEQPQREPTVSILKACELVGVCRRTMYNWLADNKVEYIRTPGGAVRILTRSLFKPGNVDIRLRVADERF